MSEPSPFPLPVTLDAVTRDWVEAALRTRAPGVRLLGCEVLDVIHGTCTKVRLQIELDAVGRAGGIPQWVILKGGFEPHSRGMHAMHESEVRGYAEVLPISPLRSPACHFAGYDAAARQGIVIMDDLVARGVDFCDAQKPQTADEVAKRLSVLARHHALAWASPELREGGRWGWTIPVLDAHRHYLAPFLEPEVWNGYRDLPRGAAASVRFHDRDWVSEAIERLHRFAGTLPWTLLHGDTHLGNLYVDVDGQPGFFDSLPQRGPAMNEIAYHLACALDVSDRRAHERALVAHYRDELVCHGVDAPPLDALMHQFGCFLAFGYSIFLINSPVFQKEAVNTAYTARFSAAMLDHDTIGKIAPL